MSLLVRYDEACRAIAAAKAVDDVVKWRDKAEAIRAYARISKNRQLEIDATEIRFRAERRLGELIDAQRNGVGLSKGGRQKTGSDRDPVSSKPCPTLAEAGIDKHLADRARSYASYDAVAFESLLASRRDRIERDRARVTVNLVEADKAVRRQAREAELATKICALPARRYGVVLDDPEWRFEVRSRASGLDRSPDNHYPTSPVHDIFARDTKMMAAIAAEACAWFRWATVPHLANAIRSIEISGFSYKTCWIWAKDKSGTGYWNRNRHEILLLATRGAVPCPAPGTQWPSLIEAPVGAHSAKPEKFLEMIEAYFPNVPKIELNRRGAARPGWDAWGNEALAADEVAA